LPSVVCHAFLRLLSVVVYHHMHSCACFQLLLYCTEEGSCIVAETFAFSSKVLWLV